MRRSGLWLCMFGIVLWVGAMALAQAQGQGRGGAAGQVRDRAAQAGGAQNKTPAADANAIAKVKAAKQDANAVKAAGAQRGKAVEEAKAKAKGQGLDQQVESLKKQVQQAHAKHLERVAKLNRLRELAEKKGNKEMLARVDKLIAKENEVFGRKQNQVQGQPRATVPAGPNEVGGRKAPAGKDAKLDVKEQKTPEIKPDVKEKKAPEAKPEKK
jgi:hypothetical protein